jgi:hypothetical protein
MTAPVGMMICAEMKMTLKRDSSTVDMTPLIFKMASSSSILKKEGEYFSIDEIRRMAEDGGYLSTEDMRRLAQDGGYFTTAEMKQMLRDKANQDHFSPKHAQGVDAYLSTEAMQRLALDDKKEPGYMTIQNMQKLVKEGGYVSPELMQRLLRENDMYMTLEDVQNAGSAPDIYLSMDEIEMLQIDGGYLTASQMQHLVKDGGYMSLNDFRQFFKHGKDPKYLNIEGMQRLVGPQHDTTGSSSSSSSMVRS